MCLSVDIVANAKHNCNMKKIKSVQEMIAEMLDAGFKQIEIARLAGTSPEQVSRMKTGQKPEYELGKRIELVYLSHIRHSAA